MRIVHLLIGASLAGTLPGCGQKGALLLPDAPHPHKTIGAAKPQSSPAPAPSPASAPSPSPAPAPPPEPAPAPAAPPRP